MLAASVGHRLEAAGADEVEALRGAVVLLRVCTEEETRRKRGVIKGARSDHKTSGPDGDTEEGETIMDVNKTYEYCFLGLWFVLRGQKLQLSGHIYTKRFLGPELLFFCH